MLLAAAVKVGRSASSRTPTSRTLHADLQRLALDYECDHATWTSSGGSKRSKASALSHRQQRDASSGYTPDLGYRAGKASKGGMAGRFSAGS